MEAKISLLVVEEGEGRRRTKEANNSLSSTPIQNSDEATWVVGVKRAGLLRSSTVGTETDKGGKLVRKGEW